MDLKKSKRKPNFSIEEITIITESCGVAPRSLVEVKDKWKNLLSQAKRENSEFKRERGKTRGGPAPKPPSAATAKIIEEYQDTPSFSGLIGFETGDSLADDLEEPSVLDQVEESEVHLPTKHATPTPKKKTLMQMTYYKCSMRPSSFKKSKTTIGGLSFEEKYNRGMRALIHIQIWLIIRSSCWAIIYVISHDCNIMQYSTSPY
ncbi:uncharacterized protein LOC116607167 [Nematostella vectensis]|uniref:uncharacterized protein LOC116607167 n=1 Tax=Nematostella vectensis TaxID=45351 RepID=UPI002076F30E|nr:uncharacterized protein LOC116607167 [Nematostella vectensis]